MISNSRTVRLENVGKTFPNGVCTLRGLSFVVAQGEFVSILGPSGCGKSTVLKLLSGLDSPSEGRAFLPTASGRRKTDTAFVFQEPTLMPWATVFENVWLPLRLTGVSRRTAAPLIESTLSQVGLGEFHAAYPAELSGGMKMRTSIARALVTRPNLLLMDEPFAALDEITRAKLGSDLMHWWNALHLSVVFVTHSIFEAAFLSQRVMVMSTRPGHIIHEVQIDEPFPRTASYRVTPAYQRCCRELSEALEQSP